MKGHSNQFVYNIFKKYAEGEACYVKIINHSSHPIEYFIAGTQKMHIGDCELKNISTQQGCDCTRGIPYFLHPRPLYRNAPIYYLLHPERKVNMTNLQILKYGEGKKYSCFQTGISFNDNVVGDITLSKPFSIQEVMKLYRAEFINSNDTVLYTDYKSIQENVRLSKWPSFGNNKDNYATIYYGKIDPAKTFIGSKNTPILNFLYDESITDILTIQNMEPEQW